MKILWIYPNSEKMHQLLRPLTSKGFIFDLAGTWKEAESLAFSYSYDALVVHWQLPDGDGLDFCRLMRHENMTLPILVTGENAQENDIIQAIDSGADDFLRLPASPEEIRVHLRLLERLQTPPEKRVKTELRHGPLNFNLLHHQFFFDDEPVSLKPKEKLILEVLLKQAGNIVSRQLIFEKVWDQYCTYPMNTLEVHMARLRRKIDKQFGVKLIHTIPGTGYKLSYNP